MRAAYIILSASMGAADFFFSRTDFVQIFDASQRN
jgi:hypothetical protein